MCYMDSDPSGKSQAERIANKAEPVAGERGFAVEWGWHTIIAREDGSRIGYSTVVDKDDVIRFLHEHAAEMLGSGVRYELRQAIATNFNRTFGIAWYHCPQFAEAERWPYRKPAAYDREGGYYRIGEYTTPQKKEPASVEGSDAEV